MPPVTRRTEREYEAQLSEIYGPPIVISSSESESDEPLKEGPISQRRRKRKSVRKSNKTTKPHKKRSVTSKPAPAVPSKDKTSTSSKLASTPSSPVKVHKHTITVLKLPSVLRASRPPSSTSTTPSSMTNRILNSPGLSSAIADSNVGFSETSAQDKLTRNNLAQEKLAQEEPAQEKLAQEKLAQEKLTHEKSAQNTNEHGRPRRFNRVIESDTNSDKSYKEGDNEEDVAHLLSGRRASSNRTTSKRTKSPKRHTPRPTSRNKSTTPSSSTSSTSSRFNKTTEPMVNNISDRSATPLSRPIPGEHRSASHNAPVLVQVVRNNDDLTEITHTAYEEQPARQLRPVAKESSSAYDRRIDAGSMATRTRATAKKILLDESTGEPLRVFVTYNTKDRLKYALLVKQLTNKDLLTQPRSDSLNLTESDYITKLAILPLLNTFKFYDIEFLQCSANLGYMPSREGYLIYDPEKDKMERQERVIEKVQILDDDEQMPIVKEEPKEDYPPYIRRLDVTTKKRKPLKLQSVSTPAPGSKQSSEPSIASTPVTVAPANPPQPSIEPEITPQPVSQAEKNIENNGSSEPIVEGQKIKSKPQVKNTEAARPYSTVDDYTILLALNRYKNNVHQVSDVLFNCLGKLLSRSPAELERRFHTLYEGKIDNILQFLKLQTIKPLPLQDIFDTIETYLDYRRFEEKIARNQAKSIATAAGQSSKYSKKNQFAFDETVAMLDYVLPIFSREKVIRQQVFVDFEQMHSCKLWPSWEARYHELRCAIDAYCVGKRIKVPKYLEKVLKKHLGPLPMSRDSKITRIVELIDMTRTNDDGAKSNNMSDEDVKVLATVLKKRHKKQHRRNTVSINTFDDPIVIDFSDREIEEVLPFHEHDNRSRNAGVRNGKEKSNTGDTNFNASNGSSANDTSSNKANDNTKKNFATRSANKPNGASNDVNPDSGKSDGSGAVPRINFKHNQLPLATSSTFSNRIIDKNVASKQATAL